MIARNLYLDLDGVMADFDFGLQRKFGFIPNHKVTDEEWAAIHAEEDFFATLPPKADAARLFENLPQMPIILTACPRMGYKDVARQKRAWVRKHIGHQVMVLPVLGGHNKPLFMHKAGDILIDDYGKNCRAWEAEGGIAIQHKHTTLTLEKLNAHW